MPNRILGIYLEVSAAGLDCMGFTHACGTAMDESEAIEYKSIANKKTWGMKVKAEYALCDQ